MTTYDVRVWSIREYKGKDRKTGKARSTFRVARKDYLALPELRAEPDVPKSTFFRWKATGQAPPPSSCPTAASVSAAATSTPGSPTGRSR
jgi:hypothetical protein